MNQVTLLFLTIFLAISLPVYAAQQAVQFSRNFIDMGTVKTGDVKTEYVDITNLTEKQLKLFIFSECDCSIETPTNAYIKPHGTYRLPVILRAHSKTDQAIEDTLSVLVELPDQQEIKLKIRASIQGSTTEKHEAAEPGKGFMIFPGTGTTMQNQPEKLYAAWFYKPGCIKCDKAWKEVSSILNKYPGFTIREYDLTLRKNILICEKMGGHLDLPADQVLRTPALYLGNGALIGDAITRDNLSNILNTRDASLATKPWEEMDRNTTAVSSLIEKGKGLSAVAVILAGLLDGINPCAFATLVFFVSFLQVMKRSRLETAVIGITFTFAVFITYLGIGLGFFTGIKPLLQFRWITITFYILSGITALILALLSFRDALLAQKGELKEMSLQLSDAMKKRIHNIISTRSRKSGIVAGTFITGILVSLLELGCTGQVYLPIITFILQVPELRVRGFLFLTAYNLAFILPLVIVFIMVFLGTGWKQANRWFMDNLVRTKVFLGLLFLFFTAMIFYNIYTSFMV